jgi:hypothetical protein
MYARQAARIAIESVQEFFGNEAENVGLEEIDLTPTNSRWQITVGFFRPWELSNRWQVTPGPPRREYKVVVIDDTTGQVLSIRNREIPEAIAV